MSEATRREPFCMELAAFLGEAGEAHGLSRTETLTHKHAWAKLTHVLFNEKEFIFIR